ncbi:MAG: RsmD family RNA methyltransferase [Planctomycetota bacterium]
MTDRVKESLFSILYTKGMLEDMVVADLFCGTGSMGLEALSRGAKFCTFIDGSRQVTGILDRNIEKARFLAESKTVCANILKVGAAPTPEYGCYDLIFCDPPLRPRHKDRQTHGTARSADQRRRHGHTANPPAFPH